MQHGVGCRDSIETQCCLNAHPFCRRTTRKQRHTQARTLHAQGSGHSSPTFRRQMSANQHTRPQRQLKRSRVLTLHDLPSVRASMFCARACVLFFLCVCFRHHPLIAQSVITLSSPIAHNDILFHLPLLAPPTCHPHLLSSASRS